MEAEIIVVIALQFVVIALIALLLSGLRSLWGQLAPLLASAQGLLSKFGGKAPKPMDLVMMGAAQMLPGLLPPIQGAIQRGIGGLFAGATKGAVAAAAVVPPVYPGLGPAQIPQLPLKE